MRSERARTVAFTFRSAPSASQKPVFLSSPYQAMATQNADNGIHRRFRTPSLHLSLECQLAQILKEVSSFHAALSFLNFSCLFCEDLMNLVYLCLCRKRSALQHKNKTMASGVAGLIMTSRRSLRISIIFRPPPLY